MEGKFLILILAVSYTQNIVLSHILTSTYDDTSMAVCKKMLAHSVLNDLCSTFGDYSEEDLTPTTQEITTMEQTHKEQIIEKCCTHPCTLIELMALC